MKILDKWFVRVSLCRPTNIHTKLTRLCLQKQGCLVIFFCFFRWWINLPVGTSGPKPGSAMHPFLPSIITRWRKQFARQHCSWWRYSRRVFFSLSQGFVLLRKLSRRKVVCAIMENYGQPILQHIKFTWYVCLGVVISCPPRPADT